MPYMWSERAWRLCNGRDKLSYLHRRRALLFMVPRDWDGTHAFGHLVVGTSKGLRSSPRSEHSCCGKDSGSVSVTITLQWKVVDPRYCQRTMGSQKSRCQVVALRAILGSASGGFGFGHHTCNAARNQLRREASCLRRAASCLRREAS